MGRSFNKVYARYRSIINDYDSFVTVMNKPLVSTVRINTLKGKKEEILEFVGDLTPRQIPFYDLGFFVEGNGIGNRIEHFLGLIYLQEASSMLPPLIMDLEPGMRVLDLCAAPGSKTTQIAQHLNNEGIIVANDSSRKRLRVLAHNLDKAGVMNTAVTNYDGKKIGKLITDYFDRVLIDVPCSAEGAYRQSKKVNFHLGLKSIKRLARLQIGLLISGFKLLKRGGIAVYSTCTFSPEENESVVNYLLNRYPSATIEPIEIKNLKTRPGLTSWDGKSFDSSLAHTVRIYPQDNNTGGFYLARIRKT